jgi:hypothetical protein
MVDKGLPKDPLSRGQPPVRGVVSLHQMAGEDDDETVMLQDMFRRAESYLSSFPWCAAVLEAYFGRGVGKIFALFLFHIVPSQIEVGEWLWVAVGDIPSTYMLIDDCRSPLEAFDMYFWGMSEWVKLARKGITSPDVPPVNAPATPEWAEKLDQRLKMLKSNIRIYFED